MRSRATRHAGSPRPRRPRGSSVRPEPARPAAASALSPAGAEPAPRPARGAARRGRRDLDRDRRHDRGDRDRGHPRPERRARVLAGGGSRPGDPRALAGVHAVGARRPRRPRADDPRRGGRAGRRLVVAAGERVAADARLLGAASLDVDESALTGESLPVAKDPAAVPRGRRSPTGRRCSMPARRSRAAAAGRSSARPAPRTEMGAIEQLAAGAKAPPTPLDAAARPARPADGRARRRDHGRPRRRDLSRAAADGGGVPDRGRGRGRRGAGGARRDGDGGARARRPRARRPRRDRAPARRDRDARRDDGDLHRQDRHADREPDPRVASSGPSTASPSASC